MKHSNSLFTFLGLAALLSVFPAFGFARDAQVACVQKQLQALGHDPGPIDGIMGGMTRRAAVQFQENEEHSQDISALPGLKRQNAVLWCRTIAKVHPITGHLRPSASLVEIVGDGGREGPQYAALISGWIYSRRHFENNYDLRPASQITIVAAEDKATMRRRLTAALAGSGTPKSIIRKAAERHCRPDGMGAAMFRHVMMFCFPPEAKTDPNFYRSHRSRIKEIMVHEYMHHVQRELALDKVPHYVRVGTKVQSRMGPAWMVEGAAMVFETDLVETLQRKRLNTAHLVIAAGGIDLRLADLTEISAVRSPESYHVSFLAAHLLSEAKGVESLIEFWRLLGDTDDWDIAFEQAFGMTLDAFEAAFEKARRSPEAAALFIEKHQ